MSFAFQAVTAAKVTGSGATSGTITWPGSASHQLLIAVFGFEGVNTTDGPWITSTPGSTGWKRATYKAPSVNGGSGLEVWFGSPWTSGTSTTFGFSGPLTFVARGLVYTGEYYNVTDDDASLRSAVSAQVVGNNPAAPSNLASANDAVVVFAADALQAGGFGAPTPSGWSGARFDDTRAAVGTVEITAADMLNVSSSGLTGVVPWSATAATAGTAGATATVVFVPLAGTNPQAAVIAADMPEYLDVGAGYTVRVTALDPTTGSVVPNVNIGKVTLTVDQIAGTPEELQVGPFMLVPGPGA